MAGLLLERCLFFVVLLNVVSCADLLSPSFVVRALVTCCYALRTLMCQLRAGLFVGCGAVSASSWFVRWLWCCISFELVCSLVEVVVLVGCQLLQGRMMKVGGWLLQLRAGCCWLVP